MKVRPIYDHVLVDVEAEWKQEIKAKNGIVGITFENEIERGLGAVRTGKVVATPRGLSTDHYLISKIQETIEVGDTIYFHFNSIDAESRVDINIQEKPYYLVSYGSIFCVVRNGELIMFAGRVLAEPVYDDDVVEEGGIKVKKSKAGIITEINVKHNIKKARLSHIGNPLRDDPTLDVQPGEIIYYAKDSDFENDIEGKTYFVMMQEDLLMKEA